MSGMPLRRYDFSRLLQVAHPEFTPAQAHRGWQALLGLPHASERSSSRARWVLVLVPLAALVGGLHLGRTFAAKPLTYSVSGGALAEDGRLHAARDRAMSFRFADGSRLDLASDSQGRLLSLSHTGGRLRIDDGEVDASVGHDADSAWELDAGPYDVLAGRASFWTRWHQRDQVFELGVRAGTVTVEGPLAESGLSLRAGQSVTIRKGDDAIIVRGENEREPPITLPANVALAAVPAPIELGLEQLLASGNPREVISAARAPGIDHALQRAGSADLLALAEAARHLKDEALAERALHITRSRFPGMAAAHDAAFALGQLFEARSATAVQAESWYATYLGEAPDGSFAAEALGRRMLLALQRSGRDGALGLAQAYLARFPAGAHAASARAVVAL